MSPPRRALIAGGGLAGLAAAIACARAGLDVRVFERTAALREFGAGLQLGPNATRVLLGWGLGPALESVAATPDRLLVRNARSGRELGALPLEGHMRTRYGAPYLTIHRADLQQLLADAAQATGRVTLALATPIERWLDEADGAAAALEFEGGQRATADLVIGADGLWSRMREQLLGDGPPRATGHLGYRALVDQSRLPDRLRSGGVNVWLGPQLHVVAYPVRRGAWLNLVAVVHARADAGPLTADDWDHATNAAQLRAALAGCTPGLQDLIRAVPDWRLWVLRDRAPMRGPGQHARGRIALVGDAAHPMRPYLAQGAGMAIEDAAELERVLSAPGCAVPAALERFASNRWQRNARVQARAERNGRIFHAAGPVAGGRDAALRLLGARLLDLPWLYRA